MSTERKQSASLSDIARVVGVSKAAVSIYVNNPDTTRVGIQTKKKIDQTLKDLAYSPNVIARSLSKRETKVIGLLLPYNGPTFKSTFVNEVLCGIHAELLIKGYSVIFLPARGSDSPTMVKNQLSEAHGYDGLILFGTRYCTYTDLVANVDQLVQAHFPFSTVNMPEMPQPVNQSILRMNDETHPLKYLFDLGHRDILLVIGRKSDPESVAAVNSYRRFADRYSCQFRDEMIVDGDFEREVAKSAVQYALSQGHRFTAVHCISDTMAVGVYDALRNAHLRIPDDVSVVGTNDSFFAEYLSPQLTTARRPLAAAGQEAARSLLRTIASGESGRKVWFDSELIVRASTTVKKTHG